MNLQFNQTVTIEVLRCSDCSNWWGYDSSRNWKGKECPFCASDRADDYLEQTEKAHRQNRSMRGVITKLKRQIKHLKSNSIPIGKVS